MNYVLRSGIVLVILYLILWVIRDQGNALPLSPNLPEMLGFLGGVLLGVYFIIYFFALASGKTYSMTKKNRCVRCGKKISKGEMYCDFHKKEVQDELIEHNHEKTKK